MLDDELDPRIEEACDTFQCHLDDMGYIVCDMELYHFAYRHDGNQDAMQCNIDELVY